MKQGKVPYELVEDTIECAGFIPNIQDHKTNARFSPEG
jgi:hypothetical protein